ncbi:MAG: hypothetical protein IJL30_05295 [Clostridia bacterium]|nr:hypothetical protein [Clostridia bacterium]
MSEHILTSFKPAKKIPSTVLPDGMITGNGDVTAVLAGSEDRVRLYIGKADFWKADGRVYTENRGGIAPLALAEILLPQLAYGDYRACQDMDGAHITLDIAAGKLTAKMRVTVCAEENTVIIELEKSFPAVSSSFSFIPLSGSDAVAEVGNKDGIIYSLRGFDTPECRFPSYGVCAAKQVSREIKNGKERIVWAISVFTNHDSAAYMAQALEKAAAICREDVLRLLDGHEKSWRKFWGKSGVTLGDKQLELYWYAGIYAVACCAKNKKFPPGLWGSYATSDGSAWFGDYHLNYNYEAPFYALSSSNHTELVDCYMAPINDFLPTAKKYSEEFFGIKGSIFPVGLGPLGLETDLRPDTKEHGHLFHGQKSNGAYAAVIPMMHWYSTRDTEFARREYYDYLLSVAEFWENYLVFEDGVYQIFNDALNEVCWYASPDSKPQGHDDKNPIVSCGLVKMLMNLIIDISSELGINIEKIPKWQHIADNIYKGDTFESEGEKILRGIDGSTELRELALECAYPAGAIGRYSAPDLFDAARNTHKRLSIWESHNRFCSYYPLAARLGIDPEEIISHIHTNIEKYGLPNGMFEFGGGGLENSAAVPATVNEMLLQSWEDVIRLFPCWKKDEDASFKSLRAYGAFLVSAKIEKGEIYAEIISEKGRILRIEKPEDGYFAEINGKKIPLSGSVTEIETAPGDVVTVKKAG